MKLKAFAKINLGLDVIGRREDGYHQVRMIMQTIRMFDQLEIEKSSTPGIRLSVNLPYVPTDSGNLVYRAASLLMEEFSIQEGVDIRLNRDFHRFEKVYPGGGGHGRRQLGCRRRSCGRQPSL